MEQKIPLETVVHKRRRYRGGQWMHNCAAYAAQANRRLPKRNQIVGERKVIMMSVKTYQKLQEIIALTRPDSCAQQ